MKEILCNIKDCKYNKESPEPEIYNHKINYIPIGRVSLYNGSCSKEEIEIEFQEKEVQGTYLIKHTIPICKSYERGEEHNATQNGN